jgi:hypothetical protein
MEIKPAVISANIAKWLKDQELKRAAKSSPLLKHASPVLVLPKFKPLSEYVGPEGWLSVPGGASVDGK